MFAIVLCFRFANDAHGPQKRAVFGFELQLLTFECKFIFAVVFEGPRWNLKLISKLHFRRILVVCMLLFQFILRHTSQWKLVIIIMNQSTDAYCVQRSHSHKYTNSFSFLSFYSILYTRINVYVWRRVGAALHTSDLFSNFGSKFNLTKVLSFLICQTA